MVNAARRDKALGGEGRVFFRGYGFIPDGWNRWSKRESRRRKSVALLAAGRHAPPVLDLREAVFEHVSFPVEFRIAASIAGSDGTRQDAGQAAMAFIEDWKGVRCAAWSLTEPVLSARTDREYRAALVSVGELVLGLA
jgi:hypothetical protein